MKSVDDFKIGDYVRFQNPTSKKLCNGIVYYNEDGIINVRACGFIASVYRVEPECLISVINEDDINEMVSI